MTPIIRKLKKSDIDQTVLLYSKIIHPAYISYGEITEGLAISPKEFSNKALNAFKKFITKSLNRDGLAVFVAINEKDIIGFVCVEINKAKAGHQEGWITDLGVEKPFRKLGIAKKLLATAYLFGNKNKVKHFFIESGYANHGAHSVFKKEGFKPLNIIFIK